MKKKKKHDKWRLTIKEQNSKWKSRCIFHRFCIKNFLLHTFCFCNLFIYLFVIIDSIYTYRTFCIFVIFNSTQRRIETVTENFLILCCVCDLAYTNNRETIKTTEYRRERNWWWEIAYKLWFVRRYWHMMINEERFV